MFALFQAGLGAGSVAPSILVPPAAKTFMKGAYPQLNVIAVGSGTLNYQWQKDGTNLVDNGHLTGATTKTLTIVNAGSGDAGNYQVVVTGAVAPSATSTPVSLALSARPLLVNFDVNTTTSPTYSGSAGLGQAGDVWNNVQSGTQGSLTEALGTPTSIGISMSGGATLDDAAGVGAAAALMEDYRYANGSFSVTISGLNSNAAYTVVTYDAGNAAGQGATLSGDIAGAAPGDYRDPLAQNTNYLVFTNVIPNSSGNLHFNVSGAPGVLNGLQIMQQDISGLTPLLGTLQPDSVTNYSGFPLRLSVRAASDSAITSYQWKKDGVNISNNGRISGANSATLNFSSLSTNDTGNYTVVVNNSVGFSTSSAVSLTVLDGRYGFVWSKPAKITTAEATLLIPGQILGAATFGGTPYTVTLTNANNMTVDFTADGSVAAITTGAGGTYGGAGFAGSGNSVFDQVMSSCNYDNAPKTIAIYNLTPGTRYSVQFFGIDMRGCCNTRQAYLQDPGLASDVSATWQMGDGVYVVGTFTASDYMQTFIELMPGTPAGQNVNSGMATAVVVRLAPPPTPTVSIVNNHDGTVTVTWDQTPNAHLQSTPSLSGTPVWTDMGTSGSVTVPISDAQYFRAVVP